MYDGVAYHCWPADTVEVRIVGPIQQNIGSKSFSCQDTAYHHVQHGQNYFLQSFDYQMRCLFFETEKWTSVGM